MALSVGDPGSIGGHQILDRLGTGGMGTVFLGRSPSGREVAVKLVHEQYASDATFRIRFRQEVAAARRVSGAFTAPVVDADPEAARPWMATQYVPGPTLAEQLHQHGPPPAAELRQLALGLVEALRDIHRAGVVHRDLKPANVLMAADGPRVIDFGISRAADHQTLTATGHVMGTPPFMSPEQLSDPRTTGPSSDVFSLAALLVFAAVGRGPFDADSPYMTAYQVVHAAPELDEVPQPLRQILERCLAKTPEERPGLDTLAQLFLGLPTRAGEVAGAPTAEATLVARADEPRADEPRAAALRADVPRAEAPQAAAPHPAAPAPAATPTTAPATGAPAPTRSRSRTRRTMLVAAASVVVLGLGAGGVVQYLEGRDSGRGAASPGAGSGGANPATPGSGNAEALPAGWRPWQAELPVENPAADQPAAGAGNVRCLTAGPATYCGGYDLRSVRLDQATGRILWQAKARRKGPSDGTVNNSAPLGAVPEAVLVSEVDSDGAARLVSLSATDGSRLWERQAAPDVYMSGAVVGRLAVGPGLKGDALVARDMVSGETRWTSFDPEGLRCNPLAMQGKLYAKCADDRGDEPNRITYLRYDAATGRPTRIATYGEGYELVGETGERLVFAKWSRTDPDSAARHANGAGEFAALELRDPTGARPVETVRLDRPRTGTPRLVGDTLCFVNPAGTVGALSAASGKGRWETPLKVPGLGLPQPDRANRVLYVPAVDGRVLALDLRTGKELWRSAARGGRAVDGAEPVMTVRTGGALLVTRTDRTVFGIAPELPGGAGQRQGKAG
ncbi:protein kinase [Streptomyces sp. NPDC004111]|uniref:protein kinase domain-containing protein n=1 Tax=Streptomyces sp. NPDC004111 TaxID=3364690 RepID=UPI0036C69905